MCVDDRALSSSVIGCHTSAYATMLDHIQFSHLTAAAHIRVMSHSTYLENSLTA